MTGQWTADQSTWPAHLRDDAPSQQCGRCGRYTRSPSEFGAECRMTQPDGYPCGGRFEPAGVLLDIYTARVGEPVPTDTTTPLPASYAPAGKGRVRLDQPARDWNDGLLTRTVAGTPQLAITWTDHRDWCEPGVMYTLVGQGRTPDGRMVRMVAHRAGRMEDDLHRGVVTTTIDLYRAQPDGVAVTWYYAKPTEGARP